MSQSTMDNRLPIQGPAWSLQNLLVTIDGTIRELNAPNSHSIEHSPPIGMLTMVPESGVHSTTCAILGAWES